MKSALILSVLFLQSYALAQQPSASSLEITLIPQESKKSFDPFAGFKAFAESVERWEDATPYWTEQYWKAKSPVRAKVETQIQSVSGKEIRHKITISPTATEKLGCKLMSQTYYLLPVPNMQLESTEYTRIARSLESLSSQLEQSEKSIANYAANLGKLEGSSADYVIASMKREEARRDELLSRIEVAKSKVMALESARFLPLASSNSIQAGYQVADGLENFIRFKDAQYVLVHGYNKENLTAKNFNSSHALGTIVSSEDGKMSLRLTSNALELPTEKGTCNWTLPSNQPLTLPVHLPHANEIASTPRENGSSIQSAKSLPAATQAQESSEANIQSGSAAR